MKERISITDFLANEYKSYGLYTLANRGVPYFEDALSPVQRLILTQASQEIEGTQSLIGRCISSGYKHGDASLGGVIAKMTREVYTSKPLLEGEGFFGNALKGAAAPRYTTSKVADWVKPILAKYSYLRSNDEDGMPKPLMLDFPVGLMTNIVAVATGWKSQMLPRRYEDVETYLNSELHGRNPLPYLKGYKGQIDTLEHDKHDIESKLDITNWYSNIEVQGLPLGVSFKKIIPKLQLWLDKNFGDHGYHITNRSTDHFDITIETYGGGLTEKQADALYAMFRYTVKENYVFVRKGQLVAYDLLSDYLDDFKVHRNHLQADHMRYNIGLVELAIAKARIEREFRVYMQSVPTPSEIQDYLGTLDDTGIEVVNGVKLIDQHTEAINQADAKIENLEHAKRRMEVELTAFLRDANFTWPNNYKVLIPDLKNN